MKLLATPENPVPDGASVGTVRSAGVAIRVARWPAGARRARGTVCIVQGRGESIEKYYETVTDLRERGFWVVTFDLRGQGGSDRMLRDPRKGHVDNFREYETDLAAVMRDVALPDCPQPYFALAHSTGGMACIRAVRSGAVRFDRVVLSSPFLGFGSTRLPPAVIGWTAATLTAIGLGELSSGSEPDRSEGDIAFDEDNVLTSDPQRFARSAGIVRAHPELSIGPPTYGWLYAACVAMRDVAEPDFGDGVRCPLLVVGGSAERLVSLPAMESLVKRVRGAGMVTIKGARHELLMERDIVREQFWAAFDAFVPGTV